MIQTCHEDYRVRRGRGTMGCSLEQPPLPDLSEYENAMRGKYTPGNELLRVRWEVRRPLFRVFPERKAIYGA